MASYLIKPFTFTAFQAKIEDYRRYRRQLTDQANGDVGQVEVDAIIATLRPTPSSDARPKSLTSATAALAIRLLRDQQAMSATELGYKLGTAEAASPKSRTAGTDRVGRAMPTCRRPRS